MDCERDIWMVPDGANPLQEHRGLREGVDTQILVDLEVGRRREPFCVPLQWCGLDCSSLDLRLVCLAAGTMRIPGFVAGEKAMTAVPVYRVLKL